MTHTGFPSRPQTPDGEERLLARAHAVRDVCRIVDQPAEAGGVPRVIVLAPISVAHHHVEFLRRMVVVRVFNPGREKGYTDGHTTPFLKALGADDESIGVAMHKVW